MTRVTLFGAKPLSVSIARYLRDHPDFELASIVTSSKEDGMQDRETLAEFARCHGIRHYHGHDLARPFEGRGISIGYPHILPRRVIDLFAHGVLNLHFGELPYYRGTGTPSFAILNGEPFFGVSLHEIDEGIDTGPMYGVAMFSVPDNATAADVTATCERLGFAFFCSMIGPICSASTPPIAQDEILRRRGDIRKPVLYRSSELARYSPVDLAQARGETLRALRALTLPSRGPTVRGDDGLTRDLNRDDAMRLISFLMEREEEGHVSPTIA